VIFVGGKKKVVHIVNCGSSGDCPCVVNVREDSTDYLDFQLFSKSVALNVAGVLRIELVLRNKDNEIATYSTAGASPQIYITDAANGEVQFRPKVGNLVNWKSPYRGYFWVYSTETVKSAIPENEELLIKVREKFA